MVLALRDRRRLETIQLIQGAALKLAAAQGADSVTVEAICAEAGVSVRTFFNYFPVREAAFVIGPPPFPLEAVTEFLAGKGSFLDALIALLKTRLPSSGDERKFLCLAQDMAAREPRVAAMQISAIHGHEIELSDLIAKRLASPPDDPRPRLLAAATLAATRVVISQWAAKGGDLDVRALLDRSLRLVAELASL